MFDPVPVSCKFVDQMEGNFDSTPIGMLDGYSFVC